MKNIKEWLSKHNVDELPDGCFLSPETREFLYQDESGTVNLGLLINAVQDVKSDDVMPQSQKQALLSKAEGIVGQTKKGSPVALSYGQGVFTAVNAKTKEDSGVEIQRFKKEMISVGDYTHPVLGWNFKVTEDRLYRWAAAFQKMKENGVDVEVPLNHSFNAKDNIGYVVDMFVDEKDDGSPALFGIHEIRGIKNIDIVRANRNVSIYLEKEYKDGKGNNYGEAIRHSSVVQSPVAPNQEDFEEVAASNQGEKSIIQMPILKLNTKGKTMDKEMLKKIKALLGTEDDVEENAALTMLVEGFEKKKTKIEDLQKKHVELEAKLSKIQKDGEQGQGEKSKAASIDPNLLEQMALTSQDKLSLLVQKGNVTAACAKKLSAVLIGEAGERKMSMLRFSPDSKQSVFSEVIEALQDNKAVELSEQSGAQVMSRETPGEDDSEEDDKEAVTAMSNGLTNEDGD